MKPSEVRKILRVRTPARTRIARVLARSHTIEDLRREAMRTLPRAVFDYLEGGADEETTLAANIDAYRRWRFLPRALVDVSSADLRSSLFGVEVPIPLVLAPTGYSRLFDPEGEAAVARAAAAAGVPYVVSTVATTSIEEVARHTSAKPWLQLYLLKERSLSWDLLDRAQQRGITVLEFSTDTAVSGRRTRDIRHGLTIPPSIGVADLADIGRRPRYWTSMVRAPALEFANVRAGSGSGQSIRDIGSQFDAALTWKDLAEVRERWSGTLLIKGPIGPLDARRAVEMGVDGLHLSNHGGRQLDRCETPLNLVASVRAAVGVTTILVDSGVRHGMDIAIALALGADAVAVGRAYLYGLAAAGEQGVAHSLTLLKDELQRALQLIGVTDIDDLRNHASEVLRSDQHR